MGIPQQKMTAGLLLTMKRSSPWDVDIEVHFLCLSMTIPVSLCLLQPADDTLGSKLPLIDGLIVRYCLGVMMSKCEQNDEEDCLKTNCH